MPRTLRQTTWTGRSSRRAPPSTAAPGRPTGRCGSRFSAGFRDGLRASRDRIAAMAVAEAGSPLGCLAGPQCDSPIGFVDFVIETLRGYDFERELPVANTMGLPSRRLVWKEAAGVVGAITPWNVPLQINLAKVFPALAAGCTVVLKPAPETPWLGAVLGEIAAATGMPPGVLNVVTGHAAAELGEQLVTDPRVDMISFTGSTATGRRIMAAASETVKKVFLELGGKSALIVPRRRRFRPGDPERGVLCPLPCRPGLRLLHPPLGAAKPLRRGDRAAGAGLRSPSASPIRPIHTRSWGR